MSALSDLAHGLPAEGLVPGDAGGVAAVADAMAGYAELLADAARALGRIEVSWEGLAASRFRDEFGLQPGRFGVAAGCFEAASTALGRYAATLASAQVAASRARDLFAEGMRAAVAAAGGPLGVDAGPLDVLLSPAGREQRLAAVELLERVRDDVDRAGNEAAECLGAAMASAPEPVSGWQHAWNFLLAVPWELNQERRDWAAGAGFGILDTLVLASNPLPIALWVGVSTKRQVNEFEWRLGADPRSGFHTAGAVVVPGVLTGAVGSGPARFGITITELDTKPPESINLFRGMRAAPDGFPELGETAKTLGVRPNTDIPVVNGAVGPGTGGMSVNTAVEGVPLFRKPPALGGTGKDVSVFTIRSEDFDSRLQVVQDSKTHGTVEPTGNMSYDAYRQLLEESRLRWTCGEPGMMPQIERRDAMIAAVEGEDGFEALKVVGQTVRSRGGASTGPHERPRSDPGSGFGRG